MPRSIFGFAVVTMLVAVRLVQAAPGDLDPTFGVGGKVVEPIPAGLIDGQILPDGRIVGVGNSIQGGWATITVARFDTGGSLDASFGTGGIVTTPLGDGDDVAFAIALQPDGRFLVAGETDHTIDTIERADMVVLRYLADGTLDPSFGDGGVVRTSFGPELDVATTVVYQPNGKIVIAGVAYQNSASRYALARFEADGTPDPTFGMGGKVVTALRASDGLLAMALQPDGKLVVGGYSSTVVNTAIWDIALVRYQPNGTLDASFGTNGVFIDSLGASLSGFNDIVLQPDGKIVGVGSKVVGFTPPNQVIVVRLDSNGALDGTFGTGGVVATNVAGAFLADGVLVQPDGGLVAAGDRYFNSGSTEGFDSQLLRLDSTGTLDVGFGSGGAVVTDMGNYDFWRAVRRQVDGKIVALGAANVGGAGGMTMARYEGTPAACGNGVPEPPETCDDGNTVPGDGCDAGCLIEPGFACTGMPSVCTSGCGDGTVGGSEECDDGALVSDDGCDATCRIESGWTCSGAPSSCLALCGDSRIVGGEECDDGNTADGDCCSASCQFEAAGSPCLDEGNVCSNDFCGSGGACQHELTPDPTCLLPTESAKAQMKIVVRDSGRNKVQFKWAKGPVVPKATFGTPVVGAPLYGFCVYDEASGTPALVLGATASGDGDCSDNECWIEKPSGWKLKNKTGAPNGIVGLKLREGLIAGKSKVQVSMKGTYLLAPPLPLATDPRVVVQVRSSDGQCYGATFSTPTTNDGMVYRAKSD